MTTEIGDRVAGYAGAGWLETMLMRDGRSLSELGADVADILGATYRGIYHIQSEVMHRRVEWHNEAVIVVTVRGEVATHDSDELAVLVMQSLAYGIRLAIRGAAPNYIRLQFTRGEFMWCGKMRRPEQLLELVPVPVRGGPAE